MMLSENIKMALASIRASRTRSFFTMMGIIIGVVSVVTIVSIGEGVKHRVAGQIRTTGENVLTVRPGKIVNRDASGAVSGINLFSASPTSTLNDADAKAIKEKASVGSVAPMSIVGAVPNKDGINYEAGVVIATSRDFPDVSGQKVEFGSFYSSDESDNRSVVIGAGVAEKLFKELVPVGQVLKIKDQEFIVRGVLEKQPNDPTNTGIDYNNALFIPLETAKKLPDINPVVYQILVKPAEGVSADQLSNEVNAAVLSSRGGKNDFTVLKADEALAATDSVLNTITTAIIAIAIVALLVGGISIMNVMLVSVSERSREIGIRKAVGATDRQIRQQFLIESAVLSVWGAGIGVLIAVAINVALLVATNLQPVMTWQPIVISVVVSVAVGIVFGVVPAVKASRKDPIDALRPS